MPVGRSDEAARVETLIVKTPLILASASRARAVLLRDAGIVAETRPADVDEAIIKQRSRRMGLSAADVARTLAMEKAITISRQAPTAMVIGADQMLECEGRWLDKATALEAVGDQLRFLRGKTHQLVSAVAVAHDKAILWTTLEQADLTMRSFSEGFLDRYLAGSAADAVGTVGGYRLEGAGSQLFSVINGDYFTILGLPLLPLLAYLREAGVIET